MCSLSIGGLGAALGWSFVEEEEEQWEEGEARESSTNISHGPVLSVEVIRCGAGCTAAHSGSTAAGGLLLGFSAKRF